MKEALEVPFHDLSPPKRILTQTLDFSRLSTMKRSSFYEMPNAVDIKNSSVINMIQGLYLQTGTLVVFLTARPTARISCGHNSISAGITSENGTSFPTLSWGLYPHVRVEPRCRETSQEPGIVCLSIYLSRKNYAASGYVGQAGQRVEAIHLFYISGYTFAHT